MRFFNFCAVLAVTAVFSVGTAQATLPDWVAAVSGADFLGTGLNTPGTPAAVDIGLYDETTGGGISYEFVVNGTDAGASSALLGIRTTDGRDSGGIKFEQWPDSGTYGLTEFGVADYDTGVAHAISTDVHVVVVNDGTDTQLYVGGAHAAAVAGLSLEIEGIVGVGGVLNDDGTTFIDGFDGSVLGLAIYDSALSDSMIQDHFEAFSRAVPEPTTLVLTCLSGLALLCQRRRFC